MTKIIDIVVVVMEMIGAIREVIEVVVNNMKAGGAVEVIENQKLCRHKHHRTLDGVKLNVGYGL